MAILKYAAKLSKMSSHEIIFRVRQQVRNRVEKVRWKINDSVKPGNLFVSSKLAQWDIGKNPFPAPAVRFFGLDDDPGLLRNAYKNNFPNCLAKISRQADDLLAHKFHFLGLDVQLSGPINWNQNPQTGKLYPKDHHTMMDTFNTEKYGDVKYVWELNRHQFFIEAAKAYFLTGDKKYAQKVWEWLEGYFKDVPHKIGINNTSVLEHAVRIFSWVWAYYFTRESGIWTSDRLELLVKQLLLQGEMIEENLSYYYSPYNHLIGELAALAFLGTVYGNSPKMKVWRDKYWKELETQWDNQFGVEGFTVEQASYYHHFTMGFYVQLALLRKQNNLPVSPHVWKNLEQALEFPLYLTRPDGALPMIGDIDSARSLYFYRPDPMWNLLPFQALGAVMFGRPDMKKIAGKPAEEILWLLGVTGLNEYKKLSSAAPEKSSRAYSDSGYYIMRDGWNSVSNYCLFDCGAIAHGVYKDDTPSAAHGHCDILSFELCLQGQPVIIDPGFHTYFGQLDWHRYFRSARGHNTIEVNGTGQAIHEGRIGWSNVSSPNFDCWASTPDLDFAGGATDRFARLPENVFHRRYILFRKGLYFLVMDEVCGASSGKSFQIESSMHFAPGELTCVENRLTYNDRLISWFSLPDSASVKIKSGANGADGGWMAKGYGNKEPAPVMRITLETSLPASLGMLFPVSDKRGPVPQFNHEKLEPDITCYQIHYKDGKEQIFLNPQRSKFIIPAAEQMETDALCTIIKNDDGKEREFFFIKVNHLQTANDKVIPQHADQPFNVLKLTTCFNDKPRIETW